MSAFGPEVLKGLGRQLRQEAENVITNNGEAEWKTVELPAFEDALTSARTMAAGLGMELRVQMRPIRKERK